MDGNLYAASSKHNIKVWRCSDHAELHTLTVHETDVYTLAMTPDGRLLGGGVVCGDGDDNDDDGYFHDDTIFVW